MNREPGTYPPRCWHLSWVQLAAAPELARKRLAAFVGCSSSRPEELERVCLRNRLEGWEK
jgi:hypothetical protein